MDIAWTKDNKKPIGFKTWALPPKTKIVLYHFEVQCSQIILKYNVHKLRKRKQNKNNSNINIEKAIRDNYKKIHQISNFKHIICLWWLRDSRNMTLYITNNQQLNWPNYN